MTDLTNLTNTVSADQLAALLARVEALEAEVAQLRADAERELPEEVVLAISAAVAAYLGHRAKVRQIRLHRGDEWSAQGRESVHTHRVRSR